MTAPLYINVVPSPYADLYSPSNWSEIKQEFQRDFCSLLKMSSESPLYTRYKWRYPKYKSSNLYNLIVFMLAQQLYQLL